LIFEPHPIKTILSKKSSKDVEDWFFGITTNVHLIDNQECWLRWGPQSNAIHKANFNRVQPNRLPQDCLYIFQKDGNKAGLEGDWKPADKLLLGAVGKTIEKTTSENFKKQTF
jgi:hypothetical protein